MLNQIKQHLNYEIKENKEEYRERLFDNILDVEEDIIAYCEFFTEHTPNDEYDASDTISNFINDMEIKAVLDKLVQRSIMATDIEVESELGFFTLNSDIYTPIDFLDMINNYNYTKLVDFTDHIKDLQEQKTYQCDVLDYHLEVFKA